MAEYFTFYSVSLNPWIYTDVICTALLKNLPFGTYLKLGRFIEKDIFFVVNKANYFQGTIF